MAGHRRAEATPSFGRLCPAMTESDFEGAAFRRLTPTSPPQFPRQRARRMAEQFLHRRRVELVDALELLGMDAAGHEQAVDPETMGAGEVGAHGIADCQHAVELDRMLLALGGDVIFYGKPHRPIYERAMELAAEFA